MSTAITRVEIRYEQDVVHARQVSRIIAEQLGFDKQDQTRMSTAVSEIARNAYQYAGGGTVEFFVEDKTPQLYSIIVRDSGPGIANLDIILAGGYVSRTGMGLGIVGSKRLVDQFQIETHAESGTTVTLSKTLPQTAPDISPQVLESISAKLMANTTDSPLEETRKQNQELLLSLEQIQQRDEELRKRERLLVAKNAELKTFAYTVSHDLKAPLRGIAGYAQELERKHLDGLSERAQFCINQVITASHNMDGLIEDLLAYSRVDTEKPTLTDVSLADLVTSILGDRKLTLDEQGVEVKVELPALIVRTWERGLHQVLTNLVDNAIKYSRHSRPPRLAISAEQTASGCRVTVADNGVGFDMKYHDRIFGLFNRLVRSDEFEGTGAGLAIVKKLLDKLGGTIRAESEPGNGATFIVELPTSLPEEPRP